MSCANLSPIEIVLQKRKEAKELPAKVYEKIFDLGVQDCARLFGIKPEEAVRFLIKALRKKGEQDRVLTFMQKDALDKICDKIEELQTFSNAKIYEGCEGRAQMWEILIAKDAVKRKLKQEYCE